MLQKLGPLNEINAGKIYEIPPGATHVGRKKGRVGFFRCLSNPLVGDFKSRSYWRFTKIPLGVRTVKFPDFGGFILSGWEHGSILWIP